MTLNLIKESLASVEKDLKTRTKGKRKILGIQGLMLIDQQKVNRNERMKATETLDDANGDHSKET